MNEAKPVVARPYLAQAHYLPVLVDSSEEATELTKALFQNVTVSLPLQTMYKEIPALKCMLAKWEKELEVAQDVLAVLPPFGKDTTCMEVLIQKVKIKAILDMSSPVNVVFFVNAAIHHVLILLLLGYFKDKSLSFAFTL
ncbi:hypothetical protein DSO57_1031132 [Entomophthora muscae]|uniref:Uncharacterized protein n=1 Tax=Entomophthora muscae TaxID=34485 RepID=A0ACC2T0P5_9FUNG|nr:hypothetical protein DSO57_1031132 [Entomophthora muscae]